MDSNFGVKARNGARRAFSHRIHVPLPLFILKIALLIGLVALSAVFIASSVLLTKKLEWQPPPLILVPGLMGSKLYVEASGVKYPKAKEEEKKYQDCPAQVPLRKSWLSEFFINQTDCELFMLSLSSDFGDQPGVSVSAELHGVPFGSSLWPVQCTYTDENPRLCDASTYTSNDENYFRRFATFLMAKLKYQAGRTLFAAPYDWRHDQQSAVMERFYEDLRVLVERAVQSTKKKAVLLGHSMGNIVISRFLKSKVDKEWQKTHLEATINVAAPYGGATGMVKAMISGRDLPLPGGNDSIPAADLVAFMRQMGFPANLLPFTNAFGLQQMLVKVGDKAFTAAQMADFLALVKTPQLVEMYAQNQPEPQPHTPMHCIYSIGMNNTELQLEYASMADKEPTNVVMGDGDGTVNAVSLRVCDQWKAQGHPVSIKQFDDFLHTQILMKDQFYAHIAELITSF